MEKNQKPCIGCTQSVCDYRRCDPYHKWFRTAWKEFRRHARRSYWETDGEKEDKFRYLHPDMIRRYLRTGPCELCECAFSCDVPCSGYWHWWNARMVWLKWMMEREGGSGCR